MSEKKKVTFAVCHVFCWCADFQAACRLKQPLPLPVGVHRFASDANARLRSMRCSQAAAPVVLHYANCGASAQDFAMSCGSERWILDRQ